MAEAEQKAPSVADVSQWKSPNCLVGQACKELLEENSAEYKKLCETKSEFGWTLDKASVCARQLKQHVGVYAGDADSFTSMASMFDKVILKYHQIDVNENKAFEEKYEKVTLPALPEGAIASTRIRTARNLKSLPFTVNMTKEQRLTLESTMQKVFDSFESPHLKGTYHPMVGMPEEDRVKYVDLHYLYINDDPTLELVGCYDDWPQGRGIFINENQEKGVFIVWVGEEDQLRIMAMAKGSDVQAVWDLFYSGVEAVHKGVKALGDDFVFDAARGYLSSCPTNIGTGMRASVHVDLPAFATKQAVKDYVKTTPHYVDIRGTRGEATNTEGVRRYDVSNKARLGSNCVEQITTMVNGVKALLEYKPPADDFVAASKIAMEVVLAQPQFAFYKHDKTGEKENLLKKAIESLGLKSGH
jgi:creatine kinase/arginine kinase